MIEWDPSGPIEEDVAAAIVVIKQEKGRKPQSTVGQARSSQRRRISHAEIEWNDCVARQGALVVVTTSLFCAGIPAQVATRSMTGSVDGIQPSVARPYLFEGGPTVLGKKTGRYPPTVGLDTLSVDGAMPGTFVGRRVTMSANEMDFRKFSLQKFPAIAAMRPASPSSRGEETFNRDSSTTAHQRSDK